MMITSKMATRRLLTVVIVFAASTDAIPTVAFPLNSQVPPIARLFEPFSYTLSPGTFDSASAMVYQLSDGPTWLSLDDGTRSLSGTPTTGDTGEQDIKGFSVEITANDESGSTSMNSTLVISRNPPPIIRIPLSAQLPTFGAFSGPSTILCHPSTLFRFDFDLGTFEAGGGTNSKLGYYAVTKDNAPLPSWIKFDDSTLSFQGRTPDYLSLIQPPQIFALQLIASDIDGFGGPSIPFNIEVGIHLLAFKNSTMFLDANAEVPIQYDEIELELDGVAITSSNLTSIIAEIPSWLSFDNSTFRLSGTPDKDSISNNVTITALDVFGDKAIANIYVDLGTQLFNGPIDDLDATIGKHFSKEFSTSLRNESDIDLATRFEPAPAWLVFDKQNKTLYGDVPPYTSPLSIKINLKATSLSSGLSASEDFELKLIAGMVTTPRTTPSLSKPTETSAATGSSHQDSATDAKGLTKGTIVAIVVPIAILAVVLLVCVLCHYRRRRRYPNKRTKPPLKSEISAPIQGSLVTDTNLNERIIPRGPLILDTSDFSSSTRTDIFGNKTNRKRDTMTSDLRKSQTSPAVMSDLRSSQSMSNPTDIALSQTEGSYRSTQDSAMPTTESNRYSSMDFRRNGPNHSRESNLRALGQLLSEEPIRESGDYLRHQPADKSYLGLRDSDLSIVPLENFTVIPRNPKDKTLQPVEYGESNKQPPVVRKSSKRKPFGILDQRCSGNGHGGRHSISPVNGILGKRRSVGHGQDWATPSSSGSGFRNSTTWVTVNENGELSNDRSTGSDMSAITDLLYSKDLASSSNHSVKRSRISNRLSTNASASRPVSRRIGSSPFFGGSTRKSQKRVDTKSRTSYADSPTVPEELIDNPTIIIYRHDEDNKQRIRDPLDVSYGTTREGTRQLKSFIHNELPKSNTKASMRSNYSRDSRFVSASISSNSQSIHGDAAGLVSSRIAQGRANVYLVPDNVSDESWESIVPSREHFRDSQGNLREYRSEEAAHLAPLTVYSRPAMGLSRSNANSPILCVGSGAKFQPGRGKRPISVDAGAGGQGSVRGKLEHNGDDYGAYV